MKPNHLVRSVSLLILASTALTAQVARQETVVPLKNWATPLYWQPSQTEKGIASSGAQLTFSSNRVSNAALTFIAITPCRLIDTRGPLANFNGIAPFSGPSIAATTTVTFPVQSATEASTDTTPAPCGTIPSIAAAYSLNLTVVPVGGGAVDYISMWPSGYSQPFVATLNDPQGAIVANAAIVPAGTVSGGISVYNQGPAAANIIVDMNGFFAAPGISFNTALGGGALGNDTTGVGNTATGAAALAVNTTGSNNTATGQLALQDNTTGFGNTATGSDALQNNNTGCCNVAAGLDALQANTTGNGNVAIGYQAMMTNNAGGSTAVGQTAMQLSVDACCDAAFGQNALQNNTFGQHDTAVGGGALSNNTTGNGNIAVGFSAATNVSGGNSNNIHIGSTGASGDSGVIRIGGSNQTTAFIAGISGATPGTPNLPVCVDGNGQLGTTGCSTPSSRRFKEQISDMGDSSSKLFQLRPVTFMYKPQYDDGSHSLQYGLIAEEVANIYPDMVGYDKDGQPASVKYQSLTPMLLNEMQKQNEEIRSLKEELAALKTLLSREPAAVARPDSSQ